MKRIIMMIIRSIWHVPGLLIRLLRMGAHPERYTEAERYGLLKEIDDYAMKNGNVDLEIHGIENLPEKNGYILFPNHQGMFDVLVLVKAMKEPVSVVMKKELENVPLLKQVIACMGAIGLDRSDARQGMKVILQVAEEVKNGKNFIIFPEGTRSKEGNRLLPFKGGSFKSAQKAKCPIVPVALIDSYKAFDTGSIKRVRVQAYILKPIAYEAYQDMKTTEIAAMVKSQIEAVIAEHE